MSDYKMDFDDWWNDPIGFKIRQYEYRKKHPIWSRAQDVYWAVWRFFRWADIKYAVRRFYWFFLRGWRGWAPNDTWSLDTYLDRVIMEAVEHLRKHHQGYPHGLTDEGWDDVLHRISFLANRHLGMVEMDFKYTAEEYDATTKALFELLGKYWGNLWD